jgi:hypothetical protein
MVLRGIVRLHIFKFLIKVLACSRIEFEVKLLTAKLIIVVLIELVDDVVEVFPVVQTEFIARSIILHGCSLVAFLVFKSSPFLL